MQTFFCRWRSHQPPSYTTQSGGAGQIKTVLNCPGHTCLVVWTGQAAMSTRHKRPSRVRYQARGAPVKSLFLHTVFFLNFYAPKWKSNRALSLIVQTGSPSISLPGSQICSNKTLFLSFKPRPLKRWAVIHSLVTQCFFKPLPSSTPLSPLNSTTSICSNYPLSPPITIWIWIPAEGWVFVFTHSGKN